MIKQLLTAAAVLLVGASTVLAQQTRQQTPSQTALQIDSIINSWATALEKQDELIGQLQARIKELEEKVPKETVPPK